MLGGRRGRPGQRQRGSVGAMTLDLQTRNGRNYTTPRSSPTNENLGQSGRPLARGRGKEVSYSERVATHVRQKRSKAKAKAVLVWVDKHDDQLFARSPISAGLATSWKWQGEFGQRLSGRGASRASTGQNAQQPAGANPRIGKGERTRPTGWKLKFNAAAGGRRKAPEGRATTPLSQARDRPNSDPVAGQVSTPS